jgi:putative nucleotidyltransferase with HDIG domain
MSNILNVIETQEFATLPPVAAKILIMLKNEYIDVREIVKVLESDPSLTLKLLRVANSPLFATRAEIVSIHQAILTLGLNRLTNIVLGVSVYSKFLMNSNKKVADIMSKFWWHSSCTGIIAKVLAKKINRNFKEMEFIGGLLHDIGKLAMIQFNPDKYLEVIELVETGKFTDIEAELQVFGTYHTEVGEHIAKLWKLPNELVSIIGYHHKIKKLSEFTEVTSVIRFSDLLCEIWGAHMYEGLSMVQFEEEESWKMLVKHNPELIDLDIEIFTFELEHEFRTSSEFLSAIST